MSGCMMGSGAHTAAGPTALCGRSSQVRQPVAAPLLLTTTPCVSRAQLGDHITESAQRARPSWQRQCTPIITVADAPLAGAPLDALFEKTDCLVRKLHKIVGPIVEVHHKPVPDAWARPVLDAMMAPYHSNCGGSWSGSPHNARTRRPTSFSSHGTDPMSQVHTFRVTEPL